jgi:hypothetical protein
VHAGRLIHLGLTPRRSPLTPRRAPSRVFRGARPRRAAPSRSHRGLLR